MSPTNVSKLDVKYMFYNQFAAEADSCLEQDIWIVLGNFIMVSGCDQTTYMMSIGRKGTEADTSNELPSQDICKIPEIASHYQCFNPINGLETAILAMQPRRLTTFLSALTGRSSRIVRFTGMESSVAVITN